MENQRSDKMSRWRVYLLELIHGVVFQVTYLKKGKGN
jgi:hypothetical protein